MVTVSTNVATTSNSSLAPTPTETGSTTCQMARDCTNGPLVPLLPPADEDETGFPEDAGAVELVAEAELVPTVLVAGTEDELIVLVATEEVVPAALVAATEVAELVATPEVAPADDETAPLDEPVDVLGDAEVALVPEERPDVLPAIPALELVTTEPLLLDAPLSSSSVSGVLGQPSSTANTAGQHQSQWRRNTVASCADTPRKIRPVARLDQINTLKCLRALCARPEVTDREFCGLW